MSNLHIDSDVLAFLAEEESRRQKERIEMLDNAEKVTEWNGWLYWEHSPEEVEDYSNDFARDGYFASVKDLLGSIEAYNAECEDENDKVDIPSYVWTCRECRMSHQFAEDLFAERLEEEAGEDAWDDVPKEAITKLDAALKEFYEATDKIVGYAPNYKKALILNQSTNMSPV